jgi:hypothetical protein
VKATPSWTIPIRLEAGETRVRDSCMGLVVFELSP